MLEWGRELQQFFSLGCSNSEMLARAIDTCDDIEIQEYLRHFPPIDEGAISKGQLLAEKLEKQAMTSEAAVLRLVSFLPMLLIAQDPGQLPDKDYDRFGNFLEALTAMCRTDVILEPSLAMMSNLTGIFYNATNNADAARKAFEEARDSRRKHTFCFSETAELELADILENLAALYREDGQFIAARGAYKEARDIRRRLVEINAQSYEPGLAGALNNLGVICADLHDFSSAHEALEEALRIYTRLEQADPQTYTSDIGMTFNNLGNLYSDVGDIGAACKVREEALKIYLELVNVDASTYEHDLAMTLYGLGGNYYQSGDYSASRRVYQETRSVYSRLAVLDPSRYEPDLAKTLNSLGSLCHEMKDLDSARTAHEEAYTIYSKLAETDPVNYQPILGMTLNSLGTLYSAERDFVLARKAHEAARKIYTILAEDDPQKYRKDLAKTLNNLGILYNDVRDFALAKQVYQEAINIRRELAEFDAQVHEPDLAITLSNYGIFYRSTRDFTSACHALEEARDIYSRLAESSPKKYMPFLAGVLVNLGNLYGDTRNFAKSLKVYEEARIIYLKLSEIDPVLYENYLGRILNNLGVLYYDTGDFAGARDAYEAARDIRRQLAQANPQAHEPDLAMTLNNLGGFYRATRDFISARRVYEDARDIYLRLAETDPRTYEHDLAGVLNNLGVIHADTLDFASAHEVYEEAKNIRRRLADADPQIYMSDLAAILNNLGALYHKVGDEFSAQESVDEASGSYDMARKAYEEARDIRRKLTEDHRQAYENDLAMTLNNLGSLYRLVSRFDDAGITYENALSIYRGLVEADAQTYRTYLATTLTNIGGICNDMHDFANALKRYEEAVSCVEMSDIKNDELYLAKGAVSQAYRHILAGSTQRPPLAFAMAATLRDGFLRACSLDAVDLAKTQAVLAKAEAVNNGQRLALFIPTSGANKSTLTVGIISTGYCQWSSIHCEGWIKLLPAEASTADHSIRHELARHIWKNLPDTMQNFLTPHPNNGYEILISGDPFWSAFPWELLQFDGGEEDFLGLHRALPRIRAIHAPYLEQLLTTKILGHGDKHVAVIAPHTTGRVPLLGVEREAMALKECIPAIGGVLTFSSGNTGEDAHDELMRQAIDTTPAVLYFSGHGTTVGNEEVLVLHRKTAQGPRFKDKISYFGRYQLDEIARNNDVKVLFSNSPLVVLNSCTTGRTREYGGQREDLVQSFLRHGAGAVIASALPIDDSVGEALGRSIFSPQALTKPTIGTLIVEVRRQLAAGLCEDIQKSTWGAWGMVHLHANASDIPPFFESHII